MNIIIKATKFDLRDLTRVLNEIKEFPKRIPANSSHDGSLGENYETYTLTKVSEILNRDKLAFDEVEEKIDVPNREHRSNYAYSKPDVSLEDTRTISDLIEGTGRVSIRSNSNWSGSSVMDEAIDASLCLGEVVKYYRSTSVEQTDGTSRQERIFWNGRELKINFLDIYPEE